MKSRILGAAILAIGVSLSSFALSFEYLEWGRGPAQFLMTKEEAAKWKTITADEDAKAFIALFWARRDPTPGTPENEYQAQFNARVEYADKNLAAAERTRGSMTDRGKTLVLYGMPKRITRSGAPRNPALTDANRDLQESQRESSNWVQWIYEESDEVTEIFGVARAQIRFVDKFGMEEYKVERGTVDLAASQQRVIARSLVQPDLTAPPDFAPAQAAAAATAAAETTPLAIETELRTEAFRTAVAEFKAAAKSPYEKPAYVSWGEYITGPGQYFVPVMMYLPKSAGLTAGQELTFFGVVHDEAGTNAIAFEEPAKLVGSKDDVYVERSLHGLPAGKHRGIFGIAENGKPVAMAAVDMQLAGSLDKEAPANSPLILSNNVYPLTEAQKPDDPFAFGGVKVVPKGDRTFRPSDELWYFFELRNPGLAEPPAPAEGAVVVTGTPAPTPKIQVRIDVEGADATGKKVKMSAPPREIEAIEMKGVPGHYGVGNAIPLASFKPGDYTINLRVTDTVRKASVTLTDRFRVVE